MPKYNKEQYTLAETYEAYKTTTNEPVTLKEFRLILDTWGVVMNEFLVRGRDVSLPHGLSVLAVRKKERPTYVDKKESAKQGKQVRKSNDHSGGYGAKVIWRRHYTTMSSRGWEFTPSRELTKAVSEVMKTPGGHQNYVKRATSTKSPDMAKKIYNQKIHKI